MKTVLTHQVVTELAGAVSDSILATFPDVPELSCYPVPRGGVPAAYVLQRVLAEDFNLNITLVDNPLHADFFFDDIVDSGTTMRRMCDEYPGIPFFALIDKTAAKPPFSKYANKWVVFPWEKEEKSEDDSIVGTILNRIQEAKAPYFANDNIASFIEPGEMELLKDEVERRIQHVLRGLLVDVDNDHNTKGTAKRVAKMYLNEVFKGRYQPAPHITDFPNAKKLDEMYLTGPITIRSACSHHFVPILGKCWIGIIPGDRVIGLSKFNRLVDWIASRPQIQEEMVMQIADYIEEQIQPLGLAVVVEATHMCMTWRGVKEPMEARMVNTVMRGVFREKPEARAEFLHFVSK